MPDHGPAEKLARRIDAEGPITVHEYMEAGNAHYYASRDPLGVAGDFTTAPEISQMFGEFVGLWLADLWMRAGRPEGACYVELGPGRGTLAVDALRAMAQAGLHPQVHFVETSPALRGAQQTRLPKAKWHDSVDTLPRRAPLLIVANEFFDALPVRQLVATARGWCERVVVHSGERFAPVPGPPVEDGLLPVALRKAPPGTVFEICPLAWSIAGSLASRIAVQGGAALILDYGHIRSAHGETLQAVRAHHFADPWRDPGAQDLTAHVDFEALAAAARERDVRVMGPVEQGSWLRVLGIDVRTAGLVKAEPKRAAEIEAAWMRLTSPHQMGSLFKAMAFVAASWPRPEGFD